MFYPDKIVARINELGLNSDKKLVILNGEKFRVSSEDFLLIKSIVKESDRKQRIELSGRRVYE